MSDTPRTDERAVTHPWVNGEAKYVAAEFARKLERDNAALQAALKCEREWVLALTKDNGLLLQAADSTNAGALAVRQGGRIEKLEEDNAALREDKERLDWLERSQKLWEGEDCLSGPEFISRAAIDAARKEKP